MSDKFQFVVSCAGRTETFSLPFYSPEGGQSEGCSAFYIDFEIELD
jgi:hypothetical protein